MKTPNGQCTKRCKWLKVTKTKKKHWKNQKKQFSESLGWDTPPSKESRNIVLFVVFVFCLFLFFLFFQCFFGFPMFFPRFLQVVPRCFHVFFVFPGFSKVVLFFAGRFKVFFRFPRFFQSCLFFCRFFQGFSKLSKCLWECSKTSVKHLKRLSCLKSWENCTPRGCRSVVLNVVLYYMIWYDIILYYIILYCN